MQINRLFDTGSQELAEYLKDNAVGKKIAGAPGKIWTILKVDISTNLPPNLATGKAATAVYLTVGD